MEETSMRPDGSRVTAASVVGCVCLGNLTCTECARIIGGAFAAIDLPASKKRRTDHSVPALRPRVDVGLEPGPGTAGDGARAQGSISGTAGPIWAEGSEAAISRMAARLGLPAAAEERAKDVFRKMEEARAWPHHRPGWSKDRSKGALYAACLSIACRNEGSPRSLRELALATAARKAEIVRMAALVRRRLGEEGAGRATAVGVVRASGYMPHYCRLLGLGDQEAAAAKEAARRLEEINLDLPHIGESVAAALVCLALERASTGRLDVLGDVAAATGVTAVTVNTVCRKLLPYAELLFA